MNTCFGNTFITFIYCYLILFSIELLVFLLRIKYSIKILSSFGHKFLKLRKQRIEENSFYSSDNQNDLAIHIQNTSKLSIAWIDLTFYINKNYFLSKSNSVIILNEISGSFKTNTLNAIMGPSGSGKSTLINCLNGNHSIGLSNESKILSSTGILKTCFIAQNSCEHLLEGLTVRQTLIYASKLKNSQIVKELDDHKIVTDLMSELLISDTADNRVESCSGGEQKRIIIASELTSYIKPNILYIDEPTSGLDSNASEILINCLKRLSSKHEMSIIVTIHQPNNELFLMFDSVYILAKRGVCLYSGSPHNLKERLIDCKIKISEDLNPIEKLLEICSNDTELDQKTILSNKTKENNKNLYNDCLKERMRPLIGKAIIAKRFNAKDLLFLFLRFLNYSYKCNYKTTLLLILMVFAFHFAYKQTINYDMIEEDGCIKIEMGMQCKSTLQDSNKEYFIRQNINYYLLMVTIISCLTIMLTTVMFSKEYKTFQNEHKNGIYFCSHNL